LTYANIMSMSGKVVEVVVEEQGPCGAVKKKERSTTWCKVKGMIEQHLIHTIGKSKVDLSRRKVNLPFFVPSWIKHHM
jgi:hypothetical protein